MSEADLEAEGMEVAEETEREGKADKGVREVAMADKEKADGGERGGLVADWPLKPPGCILW